MKNVAVYGNWAEKHWLALVALCTLTIVAQTIIIVWIAIGENLLNGIYGMKFDVESLWTGTKTIYGGFVPIISLASAGFGKHFTNSKYNTVQGQNPDLVEGGNQNAR